MKSKVVSATLMFEKVKKVNLSQKKIDLKLLLISKVLILTRD